MSCSFTLVQSTWYYTQVLKYNIKDIIKIKKNFPKLSIENIEEVHKVLNNMKKKKLKLNMITKSFLKKQIIVPISSNNSEKIMAMSSKYIANIDRALKDIKSDIIADFL